MNKIIGIDTSNYTTSLAVLDCDDMKVLNFRKLLSVKKVELGLRQSDAVFHHTKQLPELLEMAGDVLRFPQAVGVSVKPRPIEGSYMPCFLVGEASAMSMANAVDVPLYRTSHQTGHILAALYSCKRLDLLKNERFLAFHVSGGTTDMLICSPDRENVVNITDIGHSLDLKAGQLIDRTGVMLGLDFPCGSELEKLAKKSKAEFKIKPVIKDRCCCLSGVENKVRKMLDEGVGREDIAKYAIKFISRTIFEMTSSALNDFGEMPVVYAGGVMSDKIIADELSKEFDCNFASSGFSCDNAAGVAVFAAIKRGFL